MPQNDGQERNHEPTERRRQQFRDRGEFPRSRELTAAFSLFCAAMSATMFADELGLAIHETVRDTFALSSDIGPDNVRELQQVAMMGVLRLSGPVLGVVFLGTLLSGLVQTRGVVPKEAMKIKWERLDPISNAKQKFFSLQPLVELFKGVVVLTLIGAWMYIDRHEVMTVVTAGTWAAPMGVMMGVGEVMMRTLLWAMPVALLVAIADFSYQSYKHGEKMRMTDKEVKDEMKDTDGDPHTKAARKALQRKILAQVNLNHVAKADVVITNPTHYAVALRYRKDEAPAPVVVARGVDHLALKIRQEARKKGVPIVENRPLARALYAHAENDTMIPEALYGPVAEVIGLVLRKRTARRRRR